LYTSIDAEARALLPISKEVLVCGKETRELVLLSNMATIS
jgi:hypothetical protein